MLVSKDLCTLLRRFLSVDEGGTDTATPTRQQLFGLGLVPWSEIPPVFQNERIFLCKSGLGFQVVSLRSALPQSGDGSRLSARPTAARPLPLGGGETGRQRSELQNQLEQLTNMPNMQEQFRQWLDHATKPMPANYGPRRL